MWGNDSESTYFANGVAVLCSALFRYDRLSENFSDGLYAFVYFILLRYGVVGLSLKRTIL